MEGKNLMEEMLEKMIKIRMTEEKIAEKYSEQEMRCPVHLSIGQEAVAVGICTALEKTDWVFSGHRNHAHYIAKGGDLNKMIAEIYGKETGCCGGKGGSMHLTDQSCGFIGATPIVGSTVAIALGAAMTAKVEGKNRVVVAFLGDGAMETGVVNESMNYAATKKLPIIFACENNLYSVYSPLEVRQPKKRKLTDLAKGHGLKAIYVDGNNVEKVYTETKKAVDRIRKEGKPLFMELPTYRWREHCGPGYDNNIGYRSEDEFKEWRRKDPIDRYKKNTNKKDTDEIERRIQKEIQVAFEYAKSSSPPSRKGLENSVFSRENKEIIKASQNKRDMKLVTYAEAIKEGQDIMMAKISETYIMGLGVPDPKGIFGTTLDLEKKYGEERVFDIPLSENAVTGVAIGSAITGLRPILTHQRVDFALVSIDQIVNQAAKWYFMFNKTMSVPIVIRMIIGRGWGQGPQHSQSLHAWFAHIPGLKVIMPANAYDAKGMMIAAIEDNNPVILLEHRWLHGTKGYAPNEYYRVELGKSNVIRQGRDLTLIGMSYTTLECTKAADILQRYGINAEVIDLRTISPLDKETLIESVKKTGRVLVADHAESQCGISSEIITLITSNLFKNLKATPERITCPNYPLPTSHYLANGYYPNANDIVKRGMKIMNKLKEYEEDKSDKRKNEDQPNPQFVGPF